MPAWGDPHFIEQDDDSWKLVLFIRHLPHITPEDIKDMESYNPKGKMETEDEIGTYAKYVNTCNINTISALWIIPLLRARNATGTFRDGSVSRSGTIRIELPSV